MGRLAAFIWWLTERIARSVCSACSRCSISHLEEVIDCVTHQVRPGTDHAVQPQLFELSGDITQG